MALRAGTLNWELEELRWTTSVFDPLVTFTTPHFVSATSLLCHDQSQIKLGKGKPETPTTTHWSPTMLATLADFVFA
jgi:hypothetical protein